MNKKFNCTTLEEDKSSLSNNTDSTKKVCYTTRATRKIRTIPCLENILSNIETIDFPLVYHQNNEDVINYILGQRDKIEATSDFEQKQDLKENLKSFEPGIQVKISILIKNVLAISEESNNGGLGIIHGFPYFYNGCYWESITKELMKDFLSKVAIKSGFNEFHAEKDTTVKMLYNQFCTASNIPAMEEYTTKVMINLKNGTFVYDNGKYKLRDFCSEDMLTYQLPFSYDQTATAPKYLKFINEVMPDKDSQSVLAEYIGYILAKNLKLEKCLVLVGTGANGKSTWGDIISALLGKKNVAAFSLSNLCDRSGYFRAEMSNYLLSYSSEINSKGCDPDLVKQLISNEPVSARSPYGSPVTVTNYCRFLFNTNMLPKDVEQSYGYFRRFMFLHFDVTIPVNRRNPDLAKEIIENELSGVFNWVLEGLNRLVVQKKFTHSNKIESALAKATKESSSVALFIDDEGYKSSTQYIDGKNIYNEYAEYCKEAGYRSVSKIEFFRRLEDQLNIHVKRKATNGATWIYCTKKDQEALQHKENMDFVDKFVQKSITDQSKGSLK